MFTLLWQILTCIYAFILLTRGGWLQPVCGLTKTRSMLDYDTVHFHLMRNRRTVSCGLSCISTDFCTCPGLLCVFQQHTLPIFALLYYNCIRVKKKKRERERDMEQYKVVKRDAKIMNYLCSIKGPLT